MHEPLLLQVRGLTKTYGSRAGVLGALLGRSGVEVSALDDVSFSVRAGEVLGIVGESGSGKSTLGRLVAGLESPTSGEVLIHGTPVAEWQRRRSKELRRMIQVIFQDPYDSLNPRMTVGDSIGEPLVCLLSMTRRERERAVLEMLEMVELVPAAEYSRRYPAQLSGGQRQRVAIARALVVRPTIVVADEPVSMLDVSVRAGVLGLMRRLRSEMAVTYLFITHDLAVANHFADRLLTMYLGRAVEVGATNATLRDPLHPYTRALRSAVPSRRVTRAGEPVRIRPGEIGRGRPGCAFQPRCPDADDRCESERPALREIRAEAWAACHHAEKFLASATREAARRDRKDA